ncbi:MAG: hypothetical protein A2381_06660 [Bdellovibrionales bacterium RIFOXYB1_FULL_37_110]|nr:MAG: hypothetical protein A2181_08680 [Bdellovibrionales bacterium RIFOXYA1_FULL_38_20]OFZ50223.1 MAG: hypothetical protein A2417_19510 [Bdellovibrionales bacterium RIFOXYC1_FULL_37_79]OFZ54460.1 MAG: hypothetical protein A2328_12190 [Bdellovibrionales bacterium RIFOXYB2_FULL_36_6]OFZ57660.1 MAG: hypothetical protein A2381_06660 [Bdellovibrionales bacterium RIFOXYB1_FULL_37_110]OFZ61427.1 MAG: hypothetical protein A2577_01025 [Bdellovibrionales bacterium RIFOXYD1_FULL_36_51]
MKWKILVNLLSVLSGYFFTGNLWAEYRAYQYYVTSKYSFPQKTQSYLVTSTLTPDAYISYHGGNDVIALDLVQTWMCLGHTGQKLICPSPTQLDSL